MPDATRATISAPGIYYDFPSAAYFDDPCPEPSFTQSIAKVLLDRSALHAMHEHPRLAPADEADDESEKYDAAKAIGNAAHALIIGRGKDVAVADFDSWRTDKAKATREAAEIAGKVAILIKHHQRAADMVRCARFQIDAHEASDCFLFGRGEVVLAWQEDGLWFRTLIDWLHNDLCTVDDFKTGTLSAAPHVVPLRMVDAGWDIQAAMQERGLDRLDPTNAGRRKFRFVCQENRRPYALSIAELPESVMTMGRKKLEHAILRWRPCMSAGRWPGYPAEIIRPTYPEFKERQWLDREVAHEETRGREPVAADHFMGG